MPFKFMIAGTHSGVGKTSITISIIAGLKSLNYNVLPFKIGPDFIDPGYHSIVSKNPSINLDGWMLTKDYNAKNFYTRFSDKKDVAIVEGVMGLFDGFSGISEDGSSGQIAKWLNLPVILVVDCKSMARSIAAVINGYKNFDNELNLKGVILNNVGSEKHLKYLKEAINEYCNVEIVGYFFKGDLPQLPSRHLGLVTVDDNKGFKEKIKKFSEIGLKRVNFEKLLKLSDFEINFKREAKPHLKKYKIKIGVAKDNAFCFYYYDNLRILENLGVKIIFFSPLDDKHLPDVKFLYFGGGYPELYAEKLSKNISLLNEIKEFVAEGNPVYAECGGFMYLTEGIYIDNEFFPLVGIFKDKTKLNSKLRALGYREVEFLKDSFLGKKGEKARGHEFHYSHLLNNGKYLEKLYKVNNMQNNEGYIYKNCIGSYIHLHFGSNQNLFKDLLGGI